VRWIRTISIPTITAVAMGLILSTLGVQTEFAWGWALLAAGIALIVSIRSPDDPRIDAPGRTAEMSYVGSDVSRLGWAIDSRSGTVNEAVTRRVRATLKRRLARLGVDIEDESHRGLVETHLGEGLWTRLNARRVTVTEIRDALIAAERLISDPIAPNPTTPSPRETNA